jgi:hypothetical protein
LYSSVRSGLCPEGGYLSDAILNINSKNIFQVIFKISVSASQEKHPVSLIEISCLMRFGDIVGLYDDNHMEELNIICGQMQRFLMLKQVVRIVKKNFPALN